MYPGHIWTKLSRTQFRHNSLWKLNQSGNRYFAFGVETAIYNKSRFGHHHLSLSAAFFNFTKLMLKPHRQLLCQANKPCSFAHLIASSIECSARTRSTIFSPATDGYAILKATWLEMAK
ncbi:hypothetical protein HELRODRAFT_171380 [Helobdella robusta]|uniref:Uncharacterized protein n=1 Tax=Helobdella robusta TaxID=6412 RepID=T1F475_HELRO|nr:hypothetical protein HELRODRAFT_171380 [Helobdella robusta]ESO05717.1 hypothetical protein HELRODRAFT_171380 [Helobdella robusta]